ncbi:MAG TPA: hypothetical protein VD969_28275 [Symbiobacteriaceae bacterium]|nr:hypothetical protein [Symbiobacteriaceae bacterium]
MANVLDWTELALDLVSALLLIILWRSYRRHEPVAPQMYLLTMVCSVLFLGVYVVAMPPQQWAYGVRFAAPVAALGLLWGLISSRGMVLFRTRGRHFLRGNAWMPVWATLNFAGGELLEEYGPGLWGVGGLIVILLASAATVAANLVLLVTLVRVRGFYGGALRRGGRLHFCHACGTGYERVAKKCPACGVRKQRPA